MHEAGLLAAAIAEALAAGGAGDPVGPAAAARRPAAVVIRVHDPIHIGVESARMHAELALRARGLFDVPIEITADPVACPMCAVENDVQPNHPYCEACGWPLPDKGGDQVEASIRWGDGGQGDAPAGAEPPFAEDVPAGLATAAGAAPVAAAVVPGHDDPA